MPVMKTTVKFFFLLLTTTIFCQPMAAQCPPVSSGHHRVQKGETLYRISKKYRISVDQLCAWNGIQKSSILSVCQELAVTPQASGPSTFPPRPANKFQKQQGGSHRIKQGETIAGLAELYGYTEQRFRMFNGIRPTEPAWPGLVLKTSDCNCRRPHPSYDPDYIEYDPVYTDNGSPETSTPDIDPNPQDPYPTWDETIADNDDRSSSGNYDSPFGEDPFGLTAYENTDKRRNTAKPYNKNDRKIITTNKQNQKEKNIKQQWNEGVKRSETGDNAPTKTYVSPEEELMRRNRKSKPSSDKSNATGKPSVSKDAARYMTAEEIEMVNEINLVRSNPTGYIKYIEAYKEGVAAGREFGSVATCDELIAELKKTPPLSVLQPTECIYNAAKKHGDDQRPTGSTDHVGTDGSYPWDRVRRECPNMSDGNENLVGGPSSVRKSVILLLVDDGISNRGHRRTLLKKDWKYVACYKIGQVGRMPNSWVQKFGK